MRKIMLLLSFVVVLCLASPVMAGSVSMSAADIEPTLVRGDLQYALKKKQSSQVLYLTQHQIIYVSINNGSDKPINVNPGYFTLASSAKKSYGFTSEMFGLNKKLPWMDIQPLKAAKVLPGTEVDGFLMFNKSVEREWPVSLYFESPETSGIIHVELDPKAKYEQ